MAGELLLDGGIIEEVVDHELVELQVLAAGGAAADGEDTVSARVGEGGGQRGVADHAGGAEEEDTHHLRTGSRR